MKWWLDAFLFCEAGKYRCIVIDAIGDHRPPIVRPLADNVDFVTTAGPVFMSPYVPGDWVLYHPLRVAVAK